MSPAATADAELDALVAACWPRAQGHWSRFLLLQPPADGPEQEAIAQIDLATRRIGLHYRLIRRKCLEDCVEALMAHEVGHHVRYPGTLTTQARLRLLEKAILPLDNYSVVNLFTDLLINDALWPALGDHLARVYRAFTADVTAGADPAFLFYLSLYEERHGLEPGALMGPCGKAFARDHPNYRAESQLLGQDLFHLGPNLFTQFLYFVSIISRYVALDGAGGQGPDCGCGEPSPDDWADALTPTAREQEAIRRAEAEGWIRRELAKRMADRDALARRISTLPGAGGDDATRVPEVMAAYYRRQADRYLLRPPPRLVLGEATTPTTLEEWEPGDPLRDVDWPATLTQRGPLLGAAQPLRRQRVPEAEGWEVPLWQPR
ncbi:MAG TPA: hypothetical protein VFW33_04665, partial [Gemmataceae bacterium]|nr:hypothetical protein [Gemmataceae bacterium]